MLSHARTCKWLRAHSKKWQVETQDQIPWESHDLNFYFRSFDNYFKLMFFCKNGCDWIENSVNLWSGYELFALAYLSDTKNSTSILCMVNVLKFQTLFSFWTQIKCWLPEFEITKYLSAAENSKQGRPWPDCVLRRSTSLIWVCPVCQVLFGSKLVCSKF